MAGTRTALALLVVTMVSVAPLRSNDLGGVIVQEKEGVYRVMARFVVPQAPDAVLRVLTDYERIPDYLPDVKRSVVRSRGESRVLVEQDAQKRVLMFSRRIHLLLDIREERDALVFVDTSGQSFTTYEGSWHVTSSDGQTQVAYQLTAKPAFDVPTFVLMRVLRKDAHELVERLQREIAGSVVAR